MTAVDESGRDNGQHRTARRLSEKMMSRPREENEAIRQLKQAISQAQSKLKALRQKYVKGYYEGQEEQFNLDFQVAQADLSEKSAALSAATSERAG